MPGDSDVQKARLIQNMDRSGIIDRGDFLDGNVWRQRGNRPTQVLHPITEIAAESEVHLVHSCMSVLRCVCHLFRQYAITVQRTDWKVVEGEPVAAKAGCCT